MTALTLYGLPTCDACRKARKALEASGRTVTVRDIRAEPLSADEWQPLLTEFGDRLVNKKSTTWRGLSDWIQASEAEDQLAQHPALMKRPVLSDGSKMTLGWDAETQAAWGV